MENKMTKRNYFEALRAVAESGAIDFATINEEMTNDGVITFCDNELGLLDKKAEKAKERAATKAAANDELAETVKAALTADNYLTVDEVTAVVAETHPDITRSQVTYRLGKLVKAGEATKKEVSVSVDGGKARKLQAFCLVG